MNENDSVPARRAVLLVGVILRRRPGVTRWAKWAWEPVGLIPGAEPADWKVLREEDGVTDFHAATVPLELHRADVEAYRVSLAMKPPSAFVILNEGDGPSDLAVFGLTASAYEAQDYLDSGEEIVEPVALPDRLEAWITSFCAAQADDEEPFQKRRRDKKRIDLKEDGVGDVRIRQGVDVYRAPGGMKPKRLS